MNNRKKNYLFLLMAVFMLIFSGCGQSENGSETNAITSDHTAKTTESATELNTVNNDKEAEEETADQVKVVTTIFPPYDFVRNIAGDYVDLTMLLPIGTDSHSFDPTPQDIMAIQNCDVFIYCGGETDQAIERVLESLDTENIKLIAMIDLVEAVPEEIVEGMEAEEEEEDGEEEEELDEHVWTDPGNAITIVEAITSVLTEVDLEHKEQYEANSQTYIEKLEQLDESFQEVVDQSVRKTIVFGDRFPFRYFADAYGLEYYAAFPGCSGESEPSAGTVTFLIDKIKEEEIPVIFYIELSNERMADTISSETGAEKLLLHSCHNVTKDDFDAGKGYLELMQDNVENLKEALW